MEHIHLWYAHAMVNVWALTHVPDGIATYGQRGWPFFEKSLSGLLVSSDCALDMGMLRPAWTNWAHVLQDCKVKPAPPLPPDTFATELLRRTFAEDHDRELLVRRYGEAFRVAVGSAAKLQHVALHWGDREAMKIARLLPLCDSLRTLELQQNDISSKGARALQQGFNHCPLLERMSLWGNCIEPETQQAFMQAWVQSGRLAQNLELGDQRRPVPQVEIETSMLGGVSTGHGSPVLSPSQSMSPRKPPISPTAARRSPDDLAALQMAELSARQAAFEARLHVAINRISSTLTEVGDAVGSAPASPMASTVSPMLSSISPGGR